MLLALSLLASAGAVDHAAHDVVSTDHAIMSHLDGVEARLRAAPVDHLTPAQQAKRSELLDVLHDYRETRVFPHNHVAPAGRDRPVEVGHAFPSMHGRTPVFVDEHGSHCAVGYLLAVDGQHALVDRIVSGGNLRYVHEIDEPELLAWAAGAGFTVEELAQIQPAYEGDDQDGDGWVLGSDCDDNDKDINPDADEICGDDIDNNCNDEVDEVSCVERGCNSSGVAPFGLALLFLPVLLRRRR